MLYKIILLEFSNQLLFFLLMEQSIIRTSIKGKFDCQNFDEQKIINSIIVYYLNIVI